MLTFTLKLVFTTVDMKLGIAAIFKNEKPYILEWLAFHRLIGVDQFFIADNISDDGSTELLKDLDQAGYITRIAYPTKNEQGPQVPAYNLILREYGHLVDLLAFIDADEFIVPEEGVSLKKNLTPLLHNNSIGAIALNWAIFGSSGHEKYIDEPVIERFKYRAKQSTGVNRHIKTLVKPDYCEQFLNPHKVALSKGEYVKITGETFSFYERNRHGSSETIDWSPVRINHYVVKSFEEFKTRKQRRGRATVNELRKDGFFKAHDMNDEIDDSMDRFYQDVRSEVKNIEYKLLLSRYHQTRNSAFKHFKGLLSLTGEAGRWLERKMNFSLIPFSDLEKSSDYEWRAIDKDPAFILKRYGSMPKGWYMLTLKVKASIPRLDAKLYVNYGTGMSESTAIRLPLKSGSLFKKICYFSEKPTSIRFDPSNEQFQFTIEDFELSKLTSSYAEKFMRKKVSSILGKQYLNESIQDLKEKYELCFLRNQEVISYHEWRKLYLTRTLSEENKNIHSSEIISIILDSSVLRSPYISSILDSLNNQTHRCFEVIISTAQIKDLNPINLDNLKNSKNIKLFDLKNESYTKNELISSAKGKYITFINKPYFLSEHAVYFILKSINNNTESLVIYTDEDLLEKGMHSSPNLKPDWSPDLFYAQDYISGFVTFRKDFIDSTSLIKTDNIGLGVYKFLLEQACSLKPNQVTHVPHILAHNLSRDGSSVEPTARLSCIRDHFSKINPDIKVESYKGAHKIQWPLPTTLPKVSLLIPTRDGFDILSQCVESILKNTTYTDFEIIILNNQTTCTDTLSYFEEIKNHEKIKIIDYDQPFNYSAINNYGVTHATGSVIGLINNDIEVISGNWLTEMVSQAIRPEIGCVGAKLYYANDTIQHAGVICGLGGVAGHSHKHFKRSQKGHMNRLNCVQNLSAVTAAALVVRKDIYLEVNGLDEDHLKVAFNDVDFCLKVREAGYRNLWTPYAELYHHESISRGLDDTPEKKARFEKEFAYMKRKWKGKIESDPYYNPNLTHTKEDFSLRI